MEREKNIIFLYRDDLVRDKKDIPTDDVSIYDFRHSSITREQMNMADEIIFLDDKLKQLKSRY